MIVVLLLMGLFLSIPVSAAEQLDEEQQLFFSQFRYAVQAQDATRLISLTHSAALACVPEEDWEYYYGKILEGLVQVLGKRQAVHRVSKAGVAPGEPGSIAALDSGKDLSWPVIPEVRIIVQYEKQGREAVASLFLARDDGKWKWVHICTGQ